MRSICIEYNSQLGYNLLQIAKNKTNTHSLTIIRQQNKQQYKRQQGEKTPHNSQLGRCSYFTVSLVRRARRKRHTQLLLARCIQGVDAFHFAFDQLCLLGLQPLQGVFQLRQRQRRQLRATA